MARRRDVLVSLLFLSVTSLFFGTFMINKSQQQAIKVFHQSQPSVTVEERIINQKRKLIVRFRPDQWVAESFLLWIEDTLCTNLLSGEEEYTAECTLEKYEFLDTLRIRVFAVQGETLPDLIMEYVWPRWMSFGPKKRLCDRIQGSDLCGPSVFLLGPYKTGTTSIFKYLSAHPHFKLPYRPGENGMTEKVPGVQPDSVQNLKYSEELLLQHINFLQKEIRFFGQETPSSTDLNGYLSIFPPIKESDPYITADGTPSYLAKPQAAIDIAANFPSARFVVTIREPVERALSQNCYSLSINYVRDYFALTDISQLPVNRTLVMTKHQIDTIYDTMDRYVTFDIIVLQKCMKHLKEWEGIYGCACLRQYPRINNATISEYSPVLQGLYALQIKHWFKHVPREQFMFISSHDLSVNANLVMQKISRFLGLKDFDWETVTKHRFDIGVYPVHSRGVGGLVILDESERYHYACPGARHETVERLRQFYRSQSKDIQQLLQRTFW